MKSHLKEFKGVDIKHNVAPASLIEKTILLNQGKLNSTGALVVNTGVFTAVSYTHLRAHETKANIVCRLLLE